MPNLDNDLSRLAREVRFIAVHGAEGTGTDAPYTVAYVERIATELEALVNSAQAMNLNNYAADCHQANIKWWENPTTGEAIERNKGMLLMLIVSEIAECMEGERKDLMDDKLPHRKMAEVELADALIRIFDYAGAYGYDLEGAYQEKMAYNAQRYDHTHEARVQQGGKSW